ncbi:MAG: Fe-S cluster assembly protein SufB, partial [Bacteroidaceae bacterium]|nr:Fe-S cluster assembly protein SufB [Bacteroidaceae bacterium]
MEKDTGRNKENDIIEDITSGEYKYGFVTDIDTEVIEKGLNENVIKHISKMKNEPEWLLEFRLNAYRKWITMKMPKWAHLEIPEINYQDIIYYAAPKTKPTSDSKEVHEELLDTFNRLGISLDDSGNVGNVAVDAVMDSVSVKTTFSETLSKEGIIFCSFSEAVKNHPDLVKQYLASVVPYTDNYFAALNSAVFSDGSFCY